MGKVHVLDILYDHPYGVFHAGTQVSGKIVLEVGEGLKLDKIEIELKGKAHTSWTRHHGKSSTHYSGDEYYFHEFIESPYLSEFPEGRITAGLHEVLFSFRLASDLPSSFEGPYGHIRYLCSVKLVRPWKFNVSTKKAFTVVAKEDLNDIPAALEPLTADEREVVECCCISQGAILLNLVIPKTGFVSGEQMPITCQIDNQSTRSIGPVTARLKQYVHYDGSSAWGFDDSKETSMEVARIERDDHIAGGMKLQWTDEALSIPALPPRLVGCSIIDVSYTLKIAVEDYIYVALPILIGTVPLRMPRPLPSGPRDPMEVGLAVDEPPPYDEPPSYQECFLGGNDIQDDEDEGETAAGTQKLFAPRYAFYGKLSASRV